MQYTIRQHGAKWIASNGSVAIEADDPAEALYSLLAELDVIRVQSDDEAGAEFWEDMAMKAMVRLIRLLATRAPEELLRRHAKLICESIDNHLEKREGGAQ